MSKYATYPYSMQTPSARMQRVITGLQPYPDPLPLPVITGVITRDGTVTAGLGVEFTSVGTVTTNSLGVYSQTVSSGYNGTGIPHYASGSFTPAHRVYTNLTTAATAQNYAFYLPPGTETVLLNRPGAFALDFLVTSSTGYFAVQDDLGVITIYASGQVATLAFARLFCNAWPCFSATDAYNYGHITELAASGIQGIAGSLDLTLLTQLAVLTTTNNQITDVSVLGLPLLTLIDVSNGLLGIAEMNALLVDLDTNGATGGSLFATGNAAPTGGGVTAKNNLIGKGWVVQTT